jgi:PTH1 family peptidyl-tRNA hydrolase
MLVDWLAEQWGVEFRRESRFKAEIGRSSSGVRLLKPLTYMNLSGDAVAACATYFRISVPSILVVHDELDFAPGVVRLKRGGGHAGHNGLRSIALTLGSSDFLRVRLGIGHPGASHDVSAYVLQRPSSEDVKSLAVAIESVLARFDDIVAGDFDHVMSELNH